MAKKEDTFESIYSDLIKGQYAPIYFLYGEEPYYIDELADYMAKNILSETEKDFNLTVKYGADVTIFNVIDMAKRYPMMSDKQVVIIKEAQDIDKIDELASYLSNPITSTILVFCYKSSIDKRKKWVSAIAEKGVLFESKKLRDYQLPSFITQHLKRKKIEIDNKGAQMLAEFIGVDLHRLVNEMDKLMITLPKDQNKITPELIEKNIGISKDFNNFELTSALLNKDVYKANLIVKYFNDNPKNNPIQKTLPLLFNFFSNLMLAYYAPIKSEQGIADFLGLRSTWAAKDYLIGIKQFSGVKTMKIIGKLREIDARSKGVENSSATDGDLLKELVYMILH